jgi:hypothetical protein
MYFIEEEREYVPLNLKSILLYSIPLIGILLNAIILQTSGASRDFHHGPIYDEYTM